MKTTSRTKERAVAGRKSGLAELDDSITWEATHFGVKQRMTVCITAMEPPSFFADEMTRGAFKFLRHEHHFEPEKGGTKMRDLLEFEAPFGLIGRIVERLFLERYMRRFLIDRNAALKVMAESPMPPE